MNRMIIIFCKFILERDQLSIELLYKSVIYIYIYFKNKFAKILLLLLIEFKIDTLFPSVTVKLRCERGGGGSRIEDRDSSSIDYFYSRLAVGTASSQPVVGARRKFIYASSVLTRFPRACVVRIRGRRRRRRKEEKKNHFKIRDK